MRVTVRLAATGAAVVLTAAACGSAAASDPLVGTSWQLLSIDSMAPGEQPDISIDDPTKFTVTFGDDGQAAFQIDCNRGSSTWQAGPSAPDSGSLNLGPMALTRRYCQQPSADGQVLAALGRVRSFLISDGKLHLSLEADGGIMHWQPTTAAN